MSTKSGKRYYDGQSYLRYVLVTADEKTFLTQITFKSEKMESNITRRPILIPYEITKEAE